MTRVKVAEATGAALDWAVAKAQGRYEAYIRDEARPGTSIMDIGLGNTGQLLVYVPKTRSIVRSDPYKLRSPSTDWAQGGPIMEQEEIGPTRNAPCTKGREWEARPSTTAKGAGASGAMAPPP